ncbi:hypothetical protein MMC19_002941 [Ptychographa xylographoides]|nr:hypothetical protein [Ptychographa xylographoides]
MTLKDLLRRKEKLPKNGSQVQRSVVASPEFTFIRSDTNTEEILTLPSSPPVESSIKQSEGVPKGKRISRFGSLSNASNSVKDHRTEKRLSSLLDRRSHSYASSVNIPTDLPSIVDGKEGSDEKEARWEHRATILAKENPNLKHSITSNDTSGQSLPVRDLFTKEVISTRPVAHRAISDAEGDVCTI